MAYVGQKYKARLVYNCLYPEIDHSVFKECDWPEVNAQKPCGKEVDICMLVNSDHAGDKLSHRSRSDFLIYINTELVQWFSKKQYTVETSAFGAEFVTMK